MKNIFKYANHLYSRFDISPVSPGGFSKELIVLFWGINAVFFLANGLTPGNGFKFSDDNYVSCTVTKKIAKTDLYTEEIHIVNTSEYIIICPCISELPEYDVLIAKSGRSPPIKFKV